MLALLLSLLLAQTPTCSADGHTYPLGATWGPHVVKLSQFERWAIARGYEHWAVHSTTPHGKDSLDVVLMCMSRAPWPEH